MAKAVILVLIFFIFSLGAKELDSVSLQLQWKHQFQFAGFYIAKEKGYYKDAGIDVSILEYEDGHDYVSMLEDGEIDFLTRDSDAIKYWMNGSKIVLLANYFKRCPLAIVTQPSMRFPRDLEGKKLMISDADARSPGLNRMLKRFNTDIDKIKIVPPTYNVDSFEDGSVNAMSVFLTNEPFELQKRGIDYNVLNPSNYGIELYSVNLLTSEGLASKNPELAKRFTEASNKGWAYALANQEESVGLILDKYNTQNKTKNQLLFEAKETEKVMLLKTYEIGSIEEKRVQKIGHIFTEMGLAEPKSDYSSLMFEHYNKYVD